MNYDFFFYIFLYISETYFQLRKKQKPLLGRRFGLPQTSNRIYLLRNCFSSYIYLKDMYNTLKGIGKILFVSVLIILLICKFRDFTSVFTKKEINFPKFAYKSSFEHVNSSVTIHSFRRTLSSS